MVNMSVWRKSFNEYINTRCPDVSTYNFVDEYVSDVMHYDKLKRLISKQGCSWYAKRLLRHEAIEKALSYGLVWKMPQNEKQYLLEKAQEDGF